MRAVNSRGVTLIELLLTIAVIAIVATSSLPSLRGMMEQQQLRGAVNDLHAEFLNARFEALRRNTPVSLSFRRDDSGALWCLALSANGPCDCFSADDCVLPGAPRRHLGSERFRGVTLATNFTPQHTATFQPARGTANAGTASVSVNGRRVEIRVSSLGRVRVCSDDLPEYPSC